MRRLLVIALSAAFACLGSGREATAQSLGDRMLAGFNDWAARNHVSDATFAATDPAGLIAKGSIGPRSPDDPIPVGYLSRPIMKVCEMLAFKATIDRQKTLGEVIPRVFRRYPPSWNVQSVTVAEAISSHSPIYPLIDPASFPRDHSRKTWPRSSHTLFCAGERRIFQNPLSDRRNMSRWRSFSRRSRSSP